MIALGGFNGSEPFPSLALFQHYVSVGKVHYLIAGSTGGANNGGGSDTSALAMWVVANFTSQSVGGVTVYDLTAPTTALSS